MKKIHVFAITLIIWGQICTGCSWTLPEVDIELPPPTPWICGLDSIIDERHGFITKYSTVYIGGNCWMRENLKFIAPVIDNREHLMCGNHPNDNCETNGVYYKGGTIHLTKKVASEIEGEGICPCGWRVASDLDWQELEKSIEMKQEELGLIVYDCLEPKLDTLARRRGVITESGSDEGVRRLLEILGFNADLFGLYSSNQFVSEAACYWTANYSSDVTCSEEPSFLEGITRYLPTGSKGIQRVSTGLTENGCFVRCVKIEE